MMNRHEFDELSKKMREKMKERFEKGIDDTKKEFKKYDKNDDFLKEKAPIAAVALIVVAVLLYVIYAHFANSPRHLAGCNAQTPIENAKKILYPDILYSSKLAEGYSKNPYLSGLYFTEKDRENIKFLNKWLTKDKTDAIKLDDFITLSKNDEDGVYECNASIYVKYGKDGKFQKIGMIHYGNRLTDDKKKVYTTVYENGTDYELLKK